MQGLRMKYFVLKPEGDDDYAKASREALAAYSNAIRDTNPVLASDLVLWIEHIENSLNMKESSDKET